MNNDLLLISEINDRVDKRSSLLLLPSVDEFLQVVDLVNPDEKRIELYSKAREKWHDQMPLYRKSLEYLSEPHRFVDNFELYAKGQIDISQLKLIPTAVISLNGSVGGYSRNWVYQDGVMYGNYTGRVLMNAIYKNPIYIGKGDDSKYSCIGLLEPRHVSKFIDQCLLEILNYIYYLHNNFMYPDNPIQLLQSLPEAIGKLEQELQEFYTTMSHGKIIG